jgi:hypothetical protein
MLPNTPRELQRWNGRFVGSVRLQLAIAKEVVHHLEMAQDHRDLSPAEQAFLKKKTQAEGTCPRILAARYHASTLATSLVKPIPIFSLSFFLKEQEGHVKMYM